MAMQYLGLTEFPQSFAVVAIVQTAFFPLLLTFFWKQLVEIVELKIFDLFWLGLIDGKFGRKESWTKTNILKQSFIYNNLVEVNEVNLEKAAAFIQGRFSGHSFIHVRNISVGRDTYIVATADPDSKQQQDLFEERLKKLNGV